MTTHSDISQIEPYWFGRTEAEARAHAEDRPEQWTLVPGYSRYLWSDKSRVRISPDGKIMSTRVLNSGYQAVNVIRDDGKRVCVLMHVMVLLAHHPAFRGLSEFPGGMETRHNPAVGDKTFNAYPEGIWPGTKKQNAAEKDEQAPQFECRNFATCGNMVHNQGRRCVPCCKAVGVEAGIMLRLGANLMTDVAKRFEFKGPDWVWKLAVQYGGYEGTKAEALAQHPSVTQRVRLAVRARRSDTL